ncbi:magnesium transporter [Catalinimonas niigatensis]|uniref:magnesium transporter n=1 Tax=Catalinimonas niigatensis TaxID=1397264 RepID=UPI00266510D2|nr:magnesium transporter [Catalinimonas niigatensis]WPP49800.1 magnesium transporter [Catalinimonas niigatensis]
MTNRNRKEEVLHYINTHVPVAYVEDTVEKMLEKIRKSDWEETLYIFITDAQNHLKGYFAFHELLKSAPDKKVTELMQPCHAVGIHHSLEYIATHAIFRNISAVPVIDEQEHFLGVIPSQTIIETLRKEHIEDMHKLAGISKESTHARKSVAEPPLRSLKHRLPWLLIGLSGSFLSSYLMADYEHMLRSYITLSFFVPGIVYLADAIGTQTETLVIRGLSLSRISIYKMIYTELRTGLMIGLILGVLSIPVAMLIAQDIQIALIVGGSIIAAGTLATSVGLILPWILHHFGIDPAFGSGPLATIIQDILSILIFLMLAKSVLG